MKKNVILKLSIVLMSIVVVLISSFGLIFFGILNPQKTFKSFFNNVFDTTSMIITEFSVDKSTTIINKGNIKIDTNAEKYKNLVGYAIEYDVELDRKTNITLVDFKLGDEEESLESTYYYDNEYFYVNFPYIISTMIKVPVEKSDDKKIINYSKEDVSYLLNIIKTSFINNVDKNKFNNSVSDLHIKSTYTVDSKEFERLLNVIINDLSKDKKSSDILLNSFNVDSTKLDKYKNSILNKFNKKYEYLEINIYNSFLLNVDRIVINTKTYNIELLIDKDSKLSIKSNDKEVLSSTFNDKKVSASINRNSKDIELDLDIDTGRDELNLNGFVNYKKENNEYIKLDLQVSSLINEKISDYDTSQAKSFNQFTDKDLKSVYKIIKMANSYIEAITGKEDVIKLTK